jgi:hypothetical protein
MRFGRRARRLVQVCKLVLSGGIQNYESRIQKDKEDTHGFHRGKPRRYHLSFFIESTDYARLAMHLGQEWCFVYDLRRQSATTTLRLRMPSIQLT